MYRLGGGHGLTVLNSTLHSLLFTLLSLQYTGEGLRDGEVTQEKESQYLRNKQCGKLPLMQIKLIVFIQTLSEQQKEMKENSYPQPHYKYRITS